MAETVENENSQNSDNNTIEENTIEGENSTEQEEILVSVSETEFVVPQEPESEELESAIETQEEVEELEPKEYFTYTLNADNSIFIASTFVSLSEAQKEHEEDVSLLYAKQETLPPSEYGAYKKVGTEIVVDEEANLKLKQQARYAEIAQMFSQKNIGIKAMAIGKPEITRAAFSEERDYITYVNEQYSSYVEQYNNAKKGLYEESENSAIVAKYEAVSSMIAPINKLSNDVRALLMKQVKEDDEAYEATFKTVAEFTVSMEEVVAGTANDKLAEFKEALGGA